MCRGRTVSLVQMRIRGRAGSLERAGGKPGTRADGRLPHKMPRQGLFENYVEHREREKQVFRSGARCEDAPPVRDEISRFDDLTVQLTENDRQEQFQLVPRVWDNAPRRLWLFPREAPGVEVDRENVAGSGVREAREPGGHRRSASGGGAEAPRRPADHRTR
jgi:hypothetical protein